MSDPKKYKHISDGVDSAFLPVDYSEGDAPLGEYVRLEEYARLAFKSECQAEGLNAFDNKLREAEGLIARMNDTINESQAEVRRLKAEVERLTADLNKMTKTPDGVDYVEVDVGFWTKSGSRLPSSYSTFWSNDKGVQS
jgi:hypothetical protein